MSTQAAQIIEFRCTSCWQPTYTEPERAGSTIVCPNCTADLVVPAATPERLRDARSVDSSSDSNPYSPTAVANDQMSDAELMKLVQQENRLTPDGQLNYSGYPNASLLSRFAAHLVDGFYASAAFTVGILTVFAAASLGVITLPEPDQSDFAVTQFDPSILIIFFFFPLVATIVQWNLIATRGQSVGKLVLSIRMITMDGRLPGFVHGVILRNWLRTLLAAVIPFFGLIDVLFILGNAQRCLHDYLAGTRVVQA